VKTFMTTKFISSDHRCRSRQMFGRAKEFYTGSSNLAPKNTSKMRPINKSSSYKFGRHFMSILAPLFSNQSMLGAISVHIFKEFEKVLRDIARSLEDFSRVFTKSKLLGVRLPLHPPSNTSASDIYSICISKSTLCNIFNKIPSFFRQCNTFPGVYQDPSSWSDCSRSCPGGQRVRTSLHTCGRQPRRDVEACGSPGGYLPWGSWSACSSSCSGRQVSEQNRALLGRISKIFQLRIFVTIRIVFLA